jgi:hypothetical protein
VTNYAETHADVEPGPSSPGSDLGLRMLAKACAASGCPTIYRSDRGTLVIQGYTVSARQAGIDLPEGELLVEIPIELLAQAASADH